jgi:hypothetical protein
MTEVEQKAAMLKNTSYDVVNQCFNVWQAENFVKVNYVVVNIDFQDFVENEYSQDEAVSLATVIGTVGGNLGKLDILVSGIQADVALPYNIKYKFKGLSFIFGKKGGIDLFDTFKKCDLGNLIREIKSLPVDEYDLIISDFEPVSTWACKRKKKACIGLSHQSAVINPNAPKPKTFDLIGNLVLRYYAPFTKAYVYPSISTTIDIILRSELNSNTFKILTLIDV